MSMRSSTAPGDLLSEPRDRVWFNAPFIDKWTVTIRIVNDGTKQIGWALKTNAPARISANPAMGVLNSKETQLLVITCEPFNNQTVDVSADRITFEWCLTPSSNTAKIFRKEWFQEDVIIRRKNMAISYNN
uniref:Major sperm protein n=1 Tax=Romanomermis culicivorax TaxID=13658 RepID=A0A915J3Z1_ROMCU